jgi:hypothetical protein
MSFNQPRAGSRFAESHHKINRIKIPIRSSRALCAWPQSAALWGREGVGDVPAPRLEAEYKESASAMCVGGSDWGKDEAKQVAQAKEARVLTYFQWFMPYCTRGLCCLPCLDCANRFLHCIANALREPN